MGILEAYANSGVRTQFFLQSKEQTKNLLIVVTWCFRNTGILVIELSCHVNQQADGIMPQKYTFT